MQYSFRQRSLLIDNLNLLESFLSSKQNHYISAYNFLTRTALLFMESRV